MQSPQPIHRSEDIRGSVLSTPTSNASLPTPHKLPAHTEIHTTSPIAAGLPILEIVKNLEEEKIINREGRAILKDALYSPDPLRREEIIKALCDVELSSHSRFAIRRLKAVIHQNGGGEVSSKSIHQFHRQQMNNNNQVNSAHGVPGHHYGQLGVPHRSPSNTSALSNTQLVRNGVDGIRHNNNSDYNTINNSKHVRASFPSSRSEVRTEDIMLPVLQSHSELNTPAITSHSPKHQNHMNNSVNHNIQHQSIKSAGAVAQQPVQQVSPKSLPNARRGKNDSSPSPTNNKSDTTNFKQKKETNEDDDSEEAEFPHLPH
jgi:DNA-binding Lrp family transcriptional regulator